MGEANTITEAQAADIAVQNKAAIEKDTRIKDYSNSAIKACVGACQVQNDSSSPKALAVYEASEIHNNMVDQYKNYAKDTTKTPDHILLLQDEIIAESTQQFQSVISRAKGELETEKARMQNELYTSKLQIDSITMGLMPSIMDDLIKQPYELMGLETMASAIGVLNARGLFPDRVTQKRGKVRQDINDAINQRYSPEPYSRLKGIADDMKMINEAERQEGLVLRRMRPDQKKIAKIKANKV